MLKEVEIRPGLSLYCDPRFFPLTQDSVLLADFAAPQLRGCGLDLGIGQGYLAALTLLRAPRLTLEDPGGRRAGPAQSPAGGLFRPGDGGRSAAAARLYERTL